MILPLPYTLEAIIIQTWVFVAALLGSLLVHEWAHVVAMRSYGKNPTVWYKYGDGFNIGYPKDYMGLTKKQKINVFGSGVLAGFAFIFLPAIWLYPSFSVGLVMVYLVGCKHDLKQMWGLRQ